MVAPGMAGAAHKPGAVPLRPLRLGDIFDAAFRIVRYNPMATVGAAVLVTAVSMALPVLALGLLFRQLPSLEDTAPTTEEAYAMVGFFGAYFGGFLLMSFGLIFVTGMIVQVVAEAAVGRRMTLAEAWAATRGRRLRLLGLALLVGFVTMVILGLYAVGWGLVLAQGDTTLIVVWSFTLPVVVVLWVWLTIRLQYLAVPALMLEDVGIIGSLVRGYELSRAQFWRIFGIYLLTSFVASAAGSIIAMPLSIGGTVLGVMMPEHYFAVIMVTNALAQILSSAFVAPFTSAVTSLQYLDQRMRKEAYDIELMRRAGITVP